MKKLLNTLFLFMTFSCAYGCEDLHIKVTNNTSDYCRVADIIPVHGYWPIGASDVPAGSSKLIIGNQSAAYGPDLKITYQCGKESITLQSQQNFSYWDAGNITATVLQSSSNIVGKYQAQVGECSEFPQYMREGRLDWTISYK